MNEFLFDPETEKLGAAPRTVDESKAMLRSDASYDDLSSNLARLLTGPDLVAGDLLRGVRPERVFKRYSDR